MTQGGGYLQFQNTTPFDDPPPYQPTTGNWNASLDPYENRATFLNGICAARNTLIDTPQTSWIYPVFVGTAVPPANDSAWGDFFETFTILTQFNAYGTIPQPVYSYLTAYPGFSDFYRSNGFDIGDCHTYVCPALGGAGSPPASWVPLTHHTGQFAAPDLN
jgi:hypothetical protein